MWAGTRERIGWGGRGDCKGNYYNCPDSRMQIRLGALTHQTRETIYWTSHTCLLCFQEVLLCSILQMQQGKCCKSTVSAMFTKKKHINSLIFLSFVHALIYNLIAMQRYKALQCTSELSLILIYAMQNCCLLWTQAAISSWFTFSPAFKFILQLYRL